MVKHVNSFSACSVSEFNIDTQDQQSFTMTITRFVPVDMTNSINDLRKYQREHLCCMEDLRINYNRTFKF